jgi:hypothetical protein
LLREVIIPGNAGLASFTTTPSPSWSRTSVLLLAFLQRVTPSESLEAGPRGTHPMTPRPSWVGPSESLEAGPRGTSHEGRPGGRVLLIDAVDAVAGLGPGA